jgi:signal transduction histidine kinase
MHSALSGDASSQEGIVSYSPEGPLPLNSLSPSLPAYTSSADDSEISRTSRALRALAVLSGSLTDALSPQDAADLVEQKALSALGATSAIVVTLGAFPLPVAPGAGLARPSDTTLHVVHTIGLPAEVRAALDELPSDSALPFADVARTGDSLFLHSEQALGRYPEWGAAMIQAGARAVAVVPVWANGELRGVLGLAWSEPQVFDEDERAFVLTLGVMCAQAIMRAHLRDAEVRARQAAEQANRSKARFVAAISHELRTPMNAILGYTELLRDGIDGDISAVQRDHLGRVHQSGRYVLNLIEELLGYARIEAAESVVRPGHADLADLVKHSVELVRPLADRKGLRIRVLAPRRPVLLDTDGRKVCQIIINLLANAVKFTDEGEVILVIRDLQSGQDHCAYIEVRDTGCGISATDQTHIFEPFWRANPLSDNIDGSTGLGLSIARQLARLLGGDLVVNSTTGRGSVFLASFAAHYVGATQVTS